MINLKKYEYQTYEELKSAIQKYNDENPLNKVKNLHMYREWARKNNAPSSPRDSYNLVEFDLKDLLGTKKCLDRTVKFFIENDITSLHKLRTIDRSEFPKYIYQTQNSLKEIDFDWSLVTNKPKRGNWVPMDKAINMYRDLITKHNLKNIRSIKDIDIPSDLPKNPTSTYEGFTWFLVTNNTNGVNEAKANRLEIARLINNQAELIDTLDDTMVAIMLSKLYDKVPLTDFIKSKIKSMVSKVIKENKPGDRKEALIELSKTIEEASTFDDMSSDLESSDVETFDSNEVAYAVDEEIIENEDSEEETIMTVCYEQRLKNVVKVTNQNILNEDLDVDVKNLMVKNAIKSLWYLECSK